jgi:hypothetical protein
MLIKPRQLVKNNLKFYFDQVFIRDGNYQNIARGTTSFDGVDVSALQPDNGAETLASLGFNSTQTNYVWQSPFKNWIYQSGLLHSNDRGEPQKAAPVLCSGVYVNGAFKPDRAEMPWGPSEGWDPTLHPTIDWINGRVIMSSGLSSSDTVQAEYSYGEVLVTLTDRTNQDMDEYVKNSRYGNNPDTWNSISYPSGRFSPLPAVFIELSEQDHQAYELGNRSLIERDQVTFYVATNSSVVLDNILDTIRLQDRRHFPIVDYNVAPLSLSGIQSERSPEYRRYSVLQSNVVCHPSGYTSLYGQGQFQSASVRLDNIRNLEAGQVTMDIEVHIIVPDGPIGTSSIGYNFFES